VSIKILNPEGDWLVQVQRQGRRKTQRGSGGGQEAATAERNLLSELDIELRLEEARALLGVDKMATPVEPPPTLRAFFSERWVEHARVVQNPTTRRISRVPFNYLLHYLGDEPLDQLLLAAKINGFVEQMKKHGPMTFSNKKDGTPRKNPTGEFTNATINKGLSNLRALLNLAYEEKKILLPPKIDLLPEDDSVAVIPPTEEQYDLVLSVADGFRPIAPFMPEVIDFDAETGLRKAEIFNLHWRSVDLVRDAIRIEQQAKTRVVNGQAWRPKHNKFREVPLSTKAKAILIKLRSLVPHGPHDLVFPNRGGAPYVRMDQAPEASGKGFFPDVVEAAGLKGIVTFHSLRHLFAVRLLTRGAPITVVSELLGHSDINLTVKRYGRFASDAKVKWDAVKVLDQPPRSPDTPRLPPAV
jgi:integrase